MTPDADDVFSYRTSAAGTVSIRFHGRPVTTLRGTAASRFLARVDGLDEAGRQLEMAKATGNFKHGNERNAKSSERGRGG